ncbi:AIG2-like family-domain-containing protein [Trichophaea hybrida]|nr:AIG2-like family-domain-containing protein [Trichophaea hybrida]
MYQQPLQITGNACFFYGTLMSPQVLSRVIYGTINPEPWQYKDLRIRPATLHDYCRHQVRHADYPGITKERGKSVKGTYVTGLNMGDMTRLDAFEGSEYDRVVVKVKVLNDDGTEGEEVEGSVYVYGDESHLVKAEWNFEEFVKEKMHRWVGDSRNILVSPLLYAEMNTG